ncbi:DUF4339 domain-containing protein [Sorangium sp. So ce118]
MKPPPLPARRPAPPIPATDERETLWHVAIAPDDIKVLTLEKLDDLFRLDLIDESTKIWRPGMATWQPLGVVAGLDATPPEPARAPGRPAPGRPAPGRPGPGRPGPAVPPVPRAMDSDHPTPVVSSLSASALLGPMDGFTNIVTRTEVAAPPASMLAASRPTPPPPMAMDPLATMSAMSVMDPMAAMSAMEPMTAQSLKDTVRTGPRARDAGRAPRLMLALSIVAGLMVTLYRNDVLLDAARSAGREKVYLKVESALGGPAFGTPRSLEKLGLAAATAR